METTTGLRERKRIRTRVAIVTATLDLCARDGFGATTVEAVAERADVSKRTFFRFFTGKEDAVVALESDLFDTALDDLAGTGWSGRVGGMVGASIAEATTRFDDEWHARFAAAARILDEVPAVEAAGLELCARTVARFRELLHPRGAAVGDHVVELALEAGVSAWRLARRDWLRHGAPDPAVLRQLLHRNVDALTAAAALEVGVHGPVRSP